MTAKSNYAFVAFLFLSILLYACRNNKKEEKQQISLVQVDTCEVIFYQFPENITKLINEEMKDRTVIYASIFMTDDNVTTLSFTYTEKSNRINTMAKKSNRKMLLNAKEIPVLFSSDFLFSNEPEDTLHWIQDFNFSFFKFDEKGNLVEKMKF
ncbi:MAG: hypothetical protein HOO86_07265 [Bacteroidales bacterium]|nr:hypothetical protein [Bacteroidales bacterium]